MHKTDIIWTVCHELQILLYAFEFGSSNLDIGKCTWGVLCKAGAIICLSRNATINNFNKVVQPDRINDVLCSNLIQLHNNIH